MLSEQLDLAERHVAGGAAVIGRQVALIQKIRRQGLDARRAERLLKQFEYTQTLWVTHRDQLLELFAVG